MLKNGIDIFYYYESIWNTSSFIMNNLDKKIGYLIKYFVISELIKQKDYLSNKNKETLISYIENVKEIKKSSSNDDLSINCDYYINFVQNIYNKTYNEDLKGTITFQTAQKFILSADMIEVFKIFNLFDFQLQRLQQFCRYKSMIIDDILKQGKKPPSGGLKDFIYNPENDLKYFIQFNQLSKRRNSDVSNFNSNLNNNNVLNNNQNLNQSTQIPNNVMKSESNYYDEIPNDPYSLIQNNIDNNNCDGNINNNNINININNNNIDNINKVNNDVKNNNNNNINSKIDNNINDINYNINNNNININNQKIDNISNIYSYPSTSQSTFLTDQSLFINLNNLNNYFNSTNNDNPIQRSNTVPLQNLNSLNKSSITKNNNEINTNFHNNNNNNINNNNNNNNNNFYFYSIPSLRTSSSTKKMYINKSDSSKNNQYPLDTNLLNQKKNEVIINNKKAIEELKYKSIDSTIKILQNSISILKKFPKTK